MNLEPQSYIAFGHLHNNVPLPDNIDLKNTALFTGHAKLPSGIALYEFLKVISCAIIVDMKTTKVLNATFTTLSPMTGAYVSSMVIGWSLNDGMEVLEKKFDKHCHISSKKAFLKAIEIACQKYRDFVKTTSEDILGDRP